MKTPKLEDFDQTPKRPVRELFSPIDDMPRIEKPTREHPIPQRQGNDIAASPGDELAASPPHPEKTSPKGLLVRRGFDYYAHQLVALKKLSLREQDAIARDTEHYFVMHLDTRHTVKLVELVSIGVLDSARVHPRETFRRAIVEGSASIIVAHNHPSGTVTPSDDDIRATEALHQAGQLLDIPLIDHLVFTSDEYFSFRANATGTIRG